jgi:hypothetical protein
MSRKWKRETSLSLPAIKIVFSIRTLYVFLVSAHTSSLVFKYPHDTTPRPQKEVSWINLLYFSFKLVCFHLQHTFLYSSPVIIICFNSNVGSDNCLNLSTYVQWGLEGNAKIMDLAGTEKFGLPQLTTDLLSQNFFKIIPNPQTMMKTTTGVLQTRVEESVIKITVSSCQSKNVVTVFL